MSEVSVLLHGTGVISETKTILRSTRLRKITEEVSAKVIVKEEFDTRGCIRFYCNEFPDLFVADWNSDYSEVGYQGISEFDYPTYKYTVKKYIYEDTKIDVYEFLFKREFFFNTNIIFYREFMRKIIQIKIGID